MSKRIFLMIVAAIAAVLPMGLIHGQATGAAPVVPVESVGGLALAPIISTVVYVAIGLVLYLLGYVIFDKVMGLDLRKELVEDQNESIGVMMAGVFIGIAIIIAAAISS